MSNLLYYFEQIGPYLNDLTINDTAVYITDREKYLFTFPGAEIALSVKPGDTIPAGEAVAESMAKNKVVRRRVPAEVLGFPYVACAIPILDNNKVIGGVVFITSIKQEEKILDLTSNLSDGLTEVFEISQNIETEAEKMVEIYEKLTSLSETLSGCIKETDSVLKVIDNFAKETNLLGLNASVEAARAGSAGKGFSVIANETRRLAINTASSAKKIEDIFVRIKAASNNQASAIENINDIILSQREAVKVVHEQIEKLNDGVNILVDDTKRLNYENTQL